MMKPNEEMKLIISKWLSSGASRIILKSESGFGRVLSIKPSSDDFVFLTEGAMDIRRSIDHLVFCTAFAPYILGGTDNPESKSFYYGEVRGHSVAYRIKKETALDIIKKNELFRELWLIEKYKSEAIWRRDSNINASTPKLAIAELITVLSQHPSEYRRTISIYKFIQERTKYSKSTINRVLNAYRVDGMLVVKNGFLVEWNPKI
ncbi:MULTISPECIES: helix-turn-helix domain-containing protein [Enterobacter cloacae complex]|uniref:helix-turn-helix domain-containing protein n=1 Tax=Enterobacter cloacae complex TaxID=354276 RepID=UPI0008FB4E48|nr:MULTISPECIES: helix-turn-helix domain-containing protein [Enterobacter cloacae complex]OZU98686.1 hypothetical protein CIW59_01910 [Enterobacter roggenkampii]WFC89393.1 helix-turn-helix domain-containing protein [Enterobacter roggenkampii]